MTSQKFFLEEKNIYGSSLTGNGPPGGFPLGNDQEIFRKKKIFSSFSCPVMARANGHFHHRGTIHVDHVNFPDFGEWELLTYNAHLESYLGEILHYFSYQYEVGEETHRPHLQFYCHTKKKYRHTALAKLPIFEAPFLRHAHVMPSCDNPSGAREYSMKEEGRILGPYEIGIFSETAGHGNQGHRSDLTAAVDLVRSRGIDALVDEMPTAYVRHANNFEKLALKFDRMLLGLEIEQDVVLIMGPSGAGKSFFARHRAFDFTGAVLPTPAWEPDLDGLGWFDGLPARRPYRVHFEDFDGSRSKFGLQQFLRLTQGNSIRARVKHGFAIYQPTEVAFSTNYHPRNWYDWSQRAEQWIPLIRRFAAVVEFHSVTDWNNYSIYFAGTDAFDTFFGYDPFGGTSPRPQYRVRRPMAGGALALALHELTALPAPSQQVVIDLTQ